MVRRIPNKFKLAVSFERGDIGWKHQLMQLDAKKNQMIWAKWSLEYYETVFWQVTRHLILTRDGHKCVECGAEKDLHVDHKEYPEFFIDENVDKLQTLCVYCHAKKTKYPLLQRTTVRKAKANKKIEEALWMFNKA